MLLRNDVLCKDLSVDGDLGTSNYHHVPLEDPLDVEAEFSHIVIFVSAGEGLGDGHGKGVFLYLPVPNGLGEQRAVRLTDIDRPVFLQEQLGRAVIGVFQFLQLVVFVLATDPKHDRQGLLRLGSCGHLRAWWRQRSERRRSKRLDRSESGCKRCRRDGCQPRSRICYHGFVSRRCIFELRFVGWFMLLRLLIASSLERSLRR
mmetsp:Transcript_18569/g.42911  ORF Transcript_18569/g.42911 Transcript_18569/m.42911 type:complete len:203 (+) Transcript_18569:1095-1703(+)